MERLPLILASASPRRRALMRTLPWRFRVRPSGAPEPIPPRGADARRWAMKLAAMKARAVARRTARGLVLGSDTLVCRRGRFLGKPSSIREARRILSFLSGEWHTVYTGVALAAAPSGRVWTAVQATRVKMKVLSEEDLDLWSRRNHDKAGAYAAQEKGNPFVETMRGDYDNVVGLPRKAVRLLLAKARKAGFIPA